MIKAWKYGQWSECSKTCGNGERVRQKICTVDNVTSTICDDSKKESLIDFCNTQLCPPEWRPGKWTPCSKTCGFGTQKR